MKTTTRNRLWAALACVGLMAGLSACTSGQNTPGPDNGGTDNATSVPTEEPEPSKDPRQIALEAEQAVSLKAPENVVKGTLATTGAKTYPAELTVLSVEANETSTRLVFALRNTSGTDEVLNPREMNERVPLMGGIRDVSITDPEAQRVLLPLLAFRKGEDPTTTSFCACSQGPLNLGDEWMVQTATFPPLEPSATTVTAKIASFEEVKDIPVTWQ